MTIVVQVGAEHLHRTQELHKKNTTVTQKWFLPRTGRIATAELCNLQRHCLVPAVVAHENLQSVRYDLGQVEFEVGRQRGGDLLREFDERALHVVVCTPVFLRFVRRLVDHAKTLGQSCEEVSSNSFSG